jgi:transposase
MKRLSLEAKEAIIKQVLGEGGKSISEVALKNHIGHSTLQKWLRAKREGRPLSKQTPIASKQVVSNPDRLHHLLSTAKLDDEALGAYCRVQGIYSHQLVKWRDEFMTDKNSTKNAEQLKELRSLKAENKSLKKDLHKKDKALAEVSALLILKKKADLIWGDRGGD